MLKSQKKTLSSVKGRLEWHMDGRVQDFAKVTFDMDADFTPLFNWNTKQIFLSLVAEYGSSRHVSRHMRMLPTNASL